MVTDSILARYEQHRDRGQLRHLHRVVAGTADKLTVRVAAGGGCIAEQCTEACVAVDRGDKTLGLSVEIKPEFGTGLASFLRHSVQKCFCPVIIERACFEYELHPARYDVRTIRIYV